MKILIVSSDDALLSSLPDELKSRDFEVLPTHFGNGGFSLYKKDGPFAFVLVDYRFIPGVNVKTCMQLVTAIHLINPFQQMAIMTAEANEARRNLPETLRHLPVLRSPFRIEQVLRLLREPVLPLSFESCATLRFYQFQPLLARLDSAANNSWRSHGYHISTASLGFIEALVRDLEQFFGS